MCCSGHAPVRARTYSVSGARSAPPGQTTVPVSGSTAALAKPVWVRASSKTGPRMRSSTWSSAVSPSAKVRRRTPCSTTVTPVMSGVSPIIARGRSREVSHRLARAASSRPTRPGAVPPRKHEPQLPTTEGGLNRLKRVDPNLCGAVHMACMEMRRAVIVEVHRNHDPEEAADRRHGADAAAQAGRYDRLSLSPASLGASLGILPAGAGCRTRNVSRDRQCRPRRRGREFLGAAEPQAALRRRLQTTGCGGRGVTRKAEASRGAFGRADPVIAQVRPFVQSRRPGAQSESALPVRRRPGPACLVAWGAIAARARARRRLFARRRLAQRHRSCAWSPLQSSGLSAPDRESSRRVADWSPPRSARGSRSRSRETSSPMPYGSSSAAPDVDLARRGLRIIGAMQPSTARGRDN